jgi:hypothetical protein
MGKQLLPEAVGPALAYILPLSFLAVIQILLFLMDLWIRKSNENEENFEITED